MPTNDASARLDLPYVAAGQLQKHVTINEALTRLDALVHAAVTSRTLAAQPEDAPDGTLYIMPAAATGTDWSQRSPGDLVRADSGGWTAVPVPDGLMAIVLDTGALILRRDGGWTGLGSIDALGRLGLNTTADATNPFAARINKALWTALETGAGGDGDLRMTFNKEGAADVLSLLFQSGFGGRAELGLIGDDDVTLKVSPDGGTWHEALRVDRASGRIGFPRGAARCQTTVFDDWGDYTVPTWARWLDVVVVGGGGGGGAGAAGASGVRYGGGGGGAGGISSAAWPTGALPATLQIATGWGATGGTGASGTGAGGGAGGPSSITASGTVLISAPGGFGGQGGTATTGTGAQGAAGLTVSNGGGNGAVSQAGQTGQSLARPDGSGGGGGGGGLDASNVARAGGAGGTGATLGRAAPGGTGGTSAPGGVGQPAAEPSQSWAGGGGGGGGANAGGAGHAGGAGASAGAGGGGGGAGSTLSGSGGAGGPGRVRITAFG